MLSASWNTEGEREILTTLEFPLARGYRESGGDLSMVATAIKSCPNLSCSGYHTPSTIMAIDKSYSYSSESSSEEKLTLDEKTKVTAYQKIRLIYSRNEETMINKRELNYDYNDEILDRLLSAPAEPFGGVTRRNLDTRYTSFEVPRQDGTWSGAIFEDFDESSKFETWFIKLVVSTNFVDYPPVSVDDHETYTDMISDLFVKRLKNTTEQDEWHLGGEKYFKQVVSFFTSRWMPIEAVLPAFPCKSSNLSKVASPLPDMGEKLALKRLITFSESVREVYSPGIKIWIVSDGHVFSDCVAVDDKTVDTYSQALQELYRSLKTDESDPVQFNSLVDIFSLKKSAFDYSILENVKLDHYLNTEIDEEAEACRKILVTSCDTDFGKLEKDINTPNHPRLHLFRGFSRFMTEDLQSHPIIDQVSRKKFKKIVGKVAFEMIKRNDAYSNLVELIFPFHLRLSIHAHKNSGPKFGIQLLASEDCFVINSVEDHECPVLSDLLHIPTPWHNSIAEFNDKKTLFVIKSGHILNGLRQGKGEGSWNTERLCYEYRTKL